MKWEYKSYAMSGISDKVRRMRFEKSGQDGWELVGFYQDTAYFKRPTDVNPKEQDISIGELPKGTTSICITPDAVFAGMITGHIDKSEDRGKTWHTVHSGTLTWYPIENIFTEGKDNLLAIDEKGTLIGSRDNGLTWEYFEKND